MDRVLTVLINIKLEMARLRFLAERGLKIRGKLGFGDRRLHFCTRVYMILNNVPATMYLNIYTTFKIQTNFKDQ